MREPKSEHNRTSEPLVHCARRPAQIPEVGRLTKRAHCWPDRHVKNDKTKELVTGFLQTNSFRLIGHSSLVDHR